MGFSVPTLVMGSAALIVYAVGICAAYYDHPWLALVFGFAGGMLGAVAAALFAIEWATTATP